MSFSGIAKKWWFSASIWNLNESVLTRGADALIIFVLIYGLSVEAFGQIAWAQAWAAPLLFFFLLPELVLYRDYADLRQKSPVELLSQLRAFRIWAVSKACLAFLLAVGMGALLSGYIPAMLFALSMVLSPQISGGDREFLRLELKGKALVGQTLFLKAAQFCVVAAAVGLGFYGVLTENQAAWFLGLGSWVVLISSALVSRFLAKKVLDRHRAPELAHRLPAWPILKKALKEFSFWQHLQANLFNWGRSLDLWFLGWILHYKNSERILEAAVANREIGLYSAALKLANLGTLLPTALTGVVAVWMGRTGGGKGPSGEQIGKEWHKLLRALGIILTVSLGQALLLQMAAPYLFKWVSRDRYSSIEIEYLRTIFWPLLLSTSLLASFYIFSQWSILRVGSVGKGTNLLGKSVGRVFGPWFMIVCVFYSQLSSGEVMAWATVWGGLLFALLATIEAYRLLRTAKK